MTEFFAGPGGSDANPGTPYALRKLTLAGVEALTWAAGDKVIIAPGTYREQWQISQSGSIGNHIEIRFDYTGQYTDGVGGVIRITGSDNDETATRNDGLWIQGDYLTFVGAATIDTCSHSNVFIDGARTGLHFLSSPKGGLLIHGEFCTGGHGFNAGDFGCSDIILDGFQAYSNRNTSNAGVRIAGISSGSGIIVRNGIIFGGQRTLQFANCDGLALNVRVEGGTNGIGTIDGASITVRNCTHRGTTYAMANEDGTIDSDYNNFVCCANDYYNTTPGAHDNQFPVIYNQLGLPSQLHPQCKLSNAPSDQEPATDMYETPRGGVDSDWGPVETPGNYGYPNDSSFSILGRGIRDSQVIIGASETIKYQMSVEWTDDAHIGTKPGIEILDESGAMLGSAYATGTGSPAEVLEVEITNPLARKRLLGLRSLNRTAYVTDPDLSVVFSAYNEILVP